MSAAIDQNKGNESPQGDQPPHAEAATGPEGRQEADAGTVYSGDHKGQDKAEIADADWTPVETPVVYATKECHAIDHRAGDDLLDHGYRVLTYANALGTVTAVALPPEACDPDERAAAGQRHADAHASGGQHLGGQIFEVPDNEALVADDVTVGKAVHRLKCKVIDHAIVRWCGAVDQEGRAPKSPVR